MFEYHDAGARHEAVPAHPARSHLPETVIDCQIDYGQLRGVPWGFSEAAHALRATVPATISTRRLARLASGSSRASLKNSWSRRTQRAWRPCCSPATAVQNLRKLERLGVAGRYGCYESVDYTPGDSERGTEVVRTYMAHHVGMSLAALDNVVHGDILQQHFHADARIRAVEQLLQEQLPLPGPIRVTPEMSASADGRRKVPTQVVRRYATPHTIGPRAHLLSNGHYLVMLTNAGGGFSAVGDTHVTRWREDAAQDCWGRSSTCATWPRGASGPLPSSRRSSSRTTTRSISSWRAPGSVGATARSMHSRGRHRTRRCGRGETADAGQSRRDRP